MNSKHIAIYFPALPSGGIERLYLNLAPYFIESDFSVTFILDRKQGTFLTSLPANAKVVELGSDRLSRTLPKLTKYLRQARPNFLLTAHPHKNIVGIWANLLAGRPAKQITTLHLSLEAAIDIEKKTISVRLLPLLYRIFLKYADKTIAVSDGLAQNYLKQHGAQKIVVIPNGVVDKNLPLLLNQSPSHPWLQDGARLPVFIALGRLHVQKDFSTLIKAFAIFLRYQTGRLIIFGEGPMLQDLKLLALELNIAEHIDIPGYIDNVFPTLRQCSAFLLSSRYEGYPLVLAEAVACGTPVVSTDCPYGPSEILADVENSILVPVGNPEALADAMKEILTMGKRDKIPSLDNSPHSVACCAAAYINIFTKLSST